MIPANLSDMMRDAKGYDRMMVALMGMKKLVIAELEKAFKGEECVLAYTNRNGVTNATEIQFGNDVDP